MTWTSILLPGAIGLAGAVGAVARYLLGQYIAKRTALTFPPGTLIINVSGAFLIGLTFALGIKHTLTSTAQSVLATGFLGGYTTFSTMSWESVQLMREISPARSLLYLAGNVIPGLLAVALGIALGRWL